jgi:hypothetical protein
VRLIDCLREAFPIPGGTTKLNSNSVTLSKDEIDELTKEYGHRCFPLLAKGIVARMVQEQVLVRPRFRLM